MTVSAVSKKEKEKTLMDVFKAMEVFFQENTSFSNVKEVFQEFRDDLDKLTKDGMVVYKAEAKKQKKEWKGHLVLQNTGNEQDGAYWWLKDEVVIGEKNKIIITDGKLCGNVTKNTRTEIFLTGDERSIETIYQVESKDFEDNSKETIILCELLIEFRRGEISSLKIKKNIDQPLSQQGSFYYRPVDVTVTYEIQL